MSTSGPCSDPGAQRPGGARPRDGAPLAVLAAALAMLHAPVLFGGRTYFLNDLTHISFPWRVLTAESLAAGRAPLWNPYAYFGLPLAGNMQTGLFSPLSTAFHFFPFAVTLGWFVFFQQWLAGLWTFLWLRRWGFRRSSCLAGAALFAAGGFLLSYVEAPNLQGTVAFLPALLLFFGRPVLFGLAAAVSLHAGYPPFWAACVAAAFFLHWLWRGVAADPGAYARSAAGAGLALVLGAPILLPGAGLARVSRRVLSMPVEERLINSVRPDELSGAATPQLTRALSRRGQRPRPGRSTIRWRTENGVKTFHFDSMYLETVRSASGSRYIPHKTFYAGWLGFSAALAGFVLLALRSPPRALLAAAGALGATLLVLGGATGPTRWLWTHLTPLAWLRGPGRFSFLITAGLVPLAAYGLDKAGGRKPALLGLAPFLILVELVAIGWAYFPTLPPDYWTNRGPVADFLNENLEGGRYFQETNLEIWAHVDKDDASDDYRRFKEDIYRTYKLKLFGIVNAVYHLPDGSGEYEPLFSEGTDKVMEALREEKDPKKLAGLMAWAGVRFWLGRVPDKGPPLKDRGAKLWRIYETPLETPRARFLEAQDEKTIEGPFASAGAPISPAFGTYERTRPDRILVSGTAPREGTLFLAEPLYPGWKAFVNGRPAQLSPALDGFMAARVPEGRVSFLLVYRPWSWTLGCLLAAGLLTFLSIWARMS